MPLQTEITLRHAGGHTECTFAHARGEDGCTRRPRGKWDFCSSSAESRVQIVWPGTGLGAGDGGEGGQVVRRAVKRNELHLPLHNPSQRSPAPVKAARSGVDLSFPSVSSLSEQTLARPARYHGNAPES